MKIMPPKKTTKRDPRFHVSFEFTVEIYRRRDKQFAWRLKGKNGEKITQSEGYTRKAKVLYIINRVHGWEIEGEFINLKDLTLK